MIPVTKPFIPPKKEVFELLNNALESEHLTNDGPLLKRYEEELAQYLGVDKSIVVNNGTIALQIAIKALGLKDEIITTPFSYVATTSSIVWEGCTPVFADVETNTFNIDPESILKAITEKTTGILATHCFGNPCKIDAIQKIAKDHNLQVIYDASHCFGTTYKGQPIFNYGDISTLSLHATKLVSSIEGGVLFSKDREVQRKIMLLRNFGHNGPYDFQGVGINGKQSEFHAAYGLATLKSATKILEKRKSDYELYRKSFEGILGVDFQQLNALGASNYSYFPILLASEERVIKVMEKLRESNIFARRYFYPLLSDLDYVICSSSTKSARFIARRILCLPLYYKLTRKEIQLVIDLVKSAL